MSKPVVIKWQSCDWIAVTIMSHSRHMRWSFSFLSPVLLLLIIEIIQIKCTVKGRQLWYNREMAPNSTRFLLFGGKCSWWQYRVLIWAVERRSRVMIRVNLWALWGNWRIFGIRCEDLMIRFYEAESLKVYGWVMGI